MKARGELFYFPIGFIRVHPEKFISRRKRSAVGFQPSAKDEQKQLDELVSGFKNNIEKFNVEPGAERWAPPKSAGNAAQRIHPFASAEERAPFGQGLVST
jgi:hypothetical protein